VLKGARYNFRLTREGRVDSVQTRIALDPFNLKTFLFEKPQLIGQNQGQVKQ
jgi:hypothetical protein